MQAYYQDVEPANLSGFYNQIENAGQGIISEKGVMYVRPEYDNVDAYIEVDTFFVAKRNNRFTRKSISICKRLLAWKTYKTYWFYHSKQSFNSILSRSIYRCL